MARGDAGDRAWDGRGGVMGYVRRYGINDSCIYAIREGLTWRHV